jgi:hypothetical protein
MHVIDLSKTGKKTKEHAIIFNPLVSKILLKCSLLKKYTYADRKQRKLLQDVSRRIKKEKQQLLEEKRRHIEEKKLLRDQANKSQYNAYHRKCGHANLKLLFKFKRHGKVIASRLPSKFLRDYRKDFPLCIAMKKRRKSLPKESISVHVLNTLVPWEEVFSDSSGKFSLRSKQGNNYFTVFVCAKTGDKIAIPHAKLKHFPLVYDCGACNICSDEPQSERRNREKRSALNGRSAPGSSEEDRPAEPRVAKFNMVSPRLVA